MSEKTRDIIIPEWLSEEKGNIGPRIRNWEKKQETEKAILIEIGNRGEEVWLPKSQIEYDEYETNTFEDYDEGEEEEIDEWEIIDDKTVGDL